MGKKLQKSRILQENSKNDKTGIVVIDHLNQPTYDWQWRSVLFCRMDGRTDVRTYGHQVGPGEIQLKSLEILCFGRLWKVGTDALTDRRTDNIRENNDHYPPWLWNGRVDQILCLVCTTISAVPCFWRQTFFLSFTPVRLGSKCFLGINQWTTAYSPWIYPEDFCNVKMFFSHDFPGFI